MLLFCSRLSELSGLVEETAHRVSDLQSKVEQTYSRGQEERRESSQLHEEHLKSECGRKIGRENIEEFCPK